MNDRANSQSRTERDELGEVQIASRYYYGINTARLKSEWFALGLKTNESLIKAYLFIKQAYSLANNKLAGLDGQISAAIAKACEEMSLENNRQQFIVEPLQSISGITINTNINEVIANKSAEILGGKPGEYKIVKTDEHVNLGQEAHSLFFLATQLAVLISLSKLEPEILNLERLLRRDALTLAKVLKVSATPNIQSTTGQWGKRLNVFATELEIAIKRIRESASTLQYNDNQERENPSIAKEADESQAIQKEMLCQLTEITGFKLKEQDWQTANDGQNEFVVSDLIFVSSALKDLATVLSKIAHVVKMAHSGPLSEDAEHLKSPDAIQAFSDSLHMVAYQAVCNNLSLTFLAQCEQLESGMLMPLLSHNLLSTIDLLQVIVVGFQRKGLL